MVLPSEICQFVTPGHTVGFQVEPRWPAIMPEEVIRWFLALEDTRNLEAARARIDGISWGIVGEQKIDRGITQVAQQHLFRKLDVMSLPSQRGKAGRPMRPMPKMITCSHPCRK